MKHSIISRFALSLAFQFSALLIFSLPLELSAQRHRGVGTGAGTKPPALQEPSPEEAARQAVDLMIEAREAQDRRNMGRALRAYRQVTRHHAGSPLAPEAHFQAGLIRKQRKQWNHAFNQFQSIVSSHPDYPGFDEVIELQFEIARLLEEGARLRLFWVIPGFRSRERAVEYYTQVVQNAPFSYKAPHALLNAARLQVRRRQPEEAIDLFGRFISDYPAHEKAAEGFFGLAHAYSGRVRGPAYDQGATREALGYFEDFTILHPDHTRVGEAEEGMAEMREMMSQSRIVIGDFYFRRRGNLEAARVFYNEAITLSPESDAAEEARERLLQIERREEIRLGRRSRLGS